MPDQEILCTVTGRVATITLNRPDKLNAWTRTMEQDVRQAMLEAGRDDGVRAIVLTGVGNFRNADSPGDRRTEAPF